MLLDNTHELLNLLEFLNSMIAFKNAIILVVSFKQNLKLKIQILAGNPVNF